jgi:hypothetical protein
MAEQDLRRELPPATSHRVEHTRVTW